MGLDWLFSQEPHTINVGHSALLCILDFPREVGSCFAPDSFDQLSTNL